jgi:hypothetical protein
MRLDSVSKIIPESVVESVLLEVNGLSDDQARDFVLRLSRRQPALLAFVTVFSEDLGSDAAGQAIYMFATVVRMFETHFDKRLQEVGKKRVESRYEEHVHTLEGLTGADERWLERVAAVQSEKQPCVWKYVVETVFERDDEIELSEEEQGSLALIMWTVVAALESSVR